MMVLIRSFARNESGATAIEYGLIAGLLSILCITALKGVGSSVNSRFSKISTALTSTN